jgi:large subunit ribosomal protein L17
MRHRVAGRGLGRTSGQRRALFRNQITDLLRYEQITTTLAKSKELQPQVEKVITLARQALTLEPADALHKRRQALAIIYDEKVVGKLFDELAERFADRNGGYTRIVRIGTRKGDGAEMSVIQLVE